jgi:ankyrin repeat protein
VRGLNLFLTDLSFEKDEISTIMWNPLHFAVFNNHLDIVKYFISDLKVSIKTIGPKAIYDNENDPTNLDTFPEDKIMLLNLAVETRNKEMLQYLLDELHFFWYSEFVVDQLLNEKFNNSVSDHVQKGAKTPWVAMI